MNHKLRNAEKAIAGFLLLFCMTFAAGCSKSESYSDMLKSEEKAVNWFLSNHRVDNNIPEGGKFEVGSDAPYYRLDDEGFIYMQVLETGNPAEPVKNGDKVYFLYSRQNIRNLWELGAAQIDSNEQTGTLSEYYFFLGDTSSKNGTLFGKGIQIPLSYLPYHSEVNLVVKSQLGFSIDQSECVPYFINIKYWKPPY